MTDPANRPLPAHRLAPRLHAALCHALAVGITLLIVLPAARGSHELIGWLPLWLLGMPLSALAVLHWLARRQAAAPALRRGARAGTQAWPAAHLRASATLPLRPARGGARRRIAEAA
ncbi:MULTISPECIES: hypothetical protein [Lysobacteraceae]|uniref:Transmembrane protein n=1 Tax=Novilysobacter avium TaxID=2781023 RepID=A0A7S6UKC6_9GAMM|nr:MULTISPECIES: hypothetical protein [Lysobacter]QOW21892.1 hypothetical protein INQ42_11810 [Lysobacter avium]QOW24350.1 hypothetical protein INQ43_11740 [Lysobacter sp. H23M47]